ncbi:isochorismatase family protein [Thermopolyspora sp. NPDC052614]|uniref:isochorismatase family protein n=1 Tax=Thermopolyspora sp. NPDC052614 TaxID=3155682 RepID=UPI00343FA002
MAILPIDPYVIPDEVPENRVAWRPDPRRSVLLVLDMQNYFLRVFARWGAPWRELMANCLALREHCADNGIPVVYGVQHAAQTPEQRGLTRDFWGPGLGADPADAQIADELAPRKGDIRINTWRYSAFQRTGLAGLLEDLGRDQVIICGIYAHLGVLMTACDAFMRDIETFVVSDAVADFSVEHHRMALHYAAQRCAVVAPTRDIIHTLASESAADGPTLGLTAARARQAAMARREAAARQEAAARRERQLRREALARQDRLVHHEVVVHREDFARREIRAASHEDMQLQAAGPAYHGRPPYAGNQSA